MHVRRDKSTKAKMWDLNPGTSKRQPLSMCVSLYRASDQRAHGVVKSCSTGEGGTTCAGRTKVWRTLSCLIKGANISQSHDEAITRYAECQACHHCQ